MTNTPNKFQEGKKIEAKEHWQTIPDNLKYGMPELKKTVSVSVGNILDFGDIRNQNKVVINGKKAKIISNTPELGIDVKFDNTGKIESYSSIDEINIFKILKKEKQHGISRKNN